MALEHSLSFAASSDALIVTNVTGDYNALSNPGGYGAPNPAFNTLAHYMLIRKKNVNNVDDVLLDNETTDPLTAIEFQVDRAVDGWYEATAIDIIIWGIGQAIETGDVRYYGGLIYEAIQDSLGSQPDTNPLDWVARTLLEIEDNDDVTTGVAAVVVYFNADVYWSRQIAQLSIKGKCGVCEDDKKALWLKKIEFHLKAATVANAQQNYADGEWNILALIALSAK